jgi:hypothetical protein
VATLLFVAGTAHAAVGDAAYRDCYSGELNLTACTPISGATATGADSGIANPPQSVLSPDGGHLYVASGGDAAVAHLARGPAGALAYRGCAGADSNSPCALIGGATADGDNTGLDGAEDLALSRDGGDLYVSASRSDSLARFTVASNGALTYRGCVTGNLGTNGCATIPTAAANGTDSGLDNAEGISISPDGRFIYLVTSSDNGIAWFARGPGGAVAYRGCLTADSDIAACERLPFAAPGADETGFDSLREIAISPDGRSLYLADDADEAVSHFSIAPDGSPEFVECLTGQNTIAPCKPIPGANATGGDTGLRSLVDVTVSPDGNSVYTISDGDEAIAHFARDTGTGRLSFSGCHSGDAEAACTSVPGANPSASDTGFEYPTVARVSPDGRSVHVTATSDDGLTTFVRNPASGALSFAGCISGQATAPCSQIPTASADGTDSGLDSPRGVTISPDATSAYVLARFDNGVAHFSLEPDATGPRLTLRARRKQRGRKVVAKLRCRDEYCPTAELGGTLAIKHRRRGAGAGAAGTKRFRLRAVDVGPLDAGERAKARLKLRKRQRRALRRRGRGAVKLKAVARDLIGNRSKERKRIKLKRRR